MGADQVVGSESHSVDADEALGIQGVIFQSSTSVLDVHGCKVRAVHTETRTNDIYFSISLSCDVKTLALLSHHCIELKEKRSSIIETNNLQCIFLEVSAWISSTVTTQKNDENQLELKQTSEMNAVHINCYTKIYKIPVICTIIRDEEYITEQYMVEQYTSVLCRTGYNSIWQL